VHGAWRSLHAGEQYLRIHPVLEEHGMARLKFLPQYFFLRGGDSRSREEEVMQIDGQQKLKCLRDQLLGNTWPIPPLMELTGNFFPNGAFTD